MSKAKLLCVMLFMSMLPSIASATDLFTPVSGDVSMTILNAVFGNLGAFGAGGTDPFAAAMSTFNGAVLTLGGILAAYTILAGTLGTAHDGEMLGKKFSSMWIPVRYSVGTALVLPVIGGGYCVMQAIVGWLIVQGVGLADNVWTQYTSAANLPQIAAAGAMTPDVKNLGYNLWQSYVCLAVLTHATTDANSASWLFSSSSIGVTTEDGATYTKYDFGDKNEANQLAKDTCGTLTVYKYSPIATTSSSVNQLFSASDANTAMQQIANAHSSAITTLMSALKTQADTLVQNNAPISSGGIDTAISAYESSVQSAATAAVSSSNAYQELSENASKSGWFLAGAWHLKISAFIDAVHSAVTKVPTASGPTNMNLSTVKDRYDEAMLAAGNTIANSSYGQAQFGIGNEPGGSNTSWFSTLKQSLTSGLDLTVIAKKAYTSSGSFVMPTGGDPIINLKSLGDYLLGVASAAYVATGIASSTIGNAPGIGMFLVSTMVIFLPPIMLAGFVCGYIVPMLPFLIWLGASIGWVVLCVEAIIAAPLWAVMHLHPHGDDLVGGATNGYRLVLALLLRPVLMVFGLIASITLTSVIGGVLEQAYADVFALSQADSGFLTFVFGALIVGPLIYGGMMFMFVKKMFELIHIIPDQLLNWIGGAGPQLGSYANDMGGGQTFAAANIAPRIGGQAAEGLKPNPLAQSGKELDGGVGAKVDAHTHNEKMSGYQGPATAESVHETSSNGKTSGYQGPATAESVLAASSNGSSDGSLSDTQNRSTLNNAVGHLGGEGSEGARKLYERIAESQTKPNHAGYSFERHVNSAFRQGLNDKFGNGAGNAAAMAGDGFKGANFNQAVDTLKNTAQSLSEKGLSEPAIKERISEASSAARSAFNAEKSTGGKQTFAHFFDYEMQIVRSEI